ncbi:Ras family protein [Tritrichomonas foetus]|uniref:Ras family protein n=1 Tax=Tritrichomonas foetus TaxID=1144522 RepID=A0A1J4KR45_9EUKA|nr:Ras family protein [Tritrichomonas foetus]|eukprot:OHT13723.1 Ras family protein [Tritrichomonas foetus]
MQENSNNIYRIVIVGSSSVGKSSIIQRLVQGVFVEDLTPTCGADFCTYQCAVQSENVKLQIWDTAGQEKFKSISKSYFRGAVGAILVYDITSMGSFDSLTSWLNDIHEYCSPNAYILLVGNKSDLENQRQVGVQLVKDFADRHMLETIETSALSGKNIKEAFARLAFEVSTRVRNGQISTAPPVNKATQLTIANDKAQNGKNDGCC